MAVSRSDLLITNAEQTEERIEFPTSEDQQHYQGRRQQGEWR